MKKVFLILLMTLLLSISGWTQGEYTIGTGTSTSNLVPAAMNYNYSVSQCLYTSSELSEVPNGAITSISYSTSNANTATRAWRILLGETSLTSLSTSSFVGENDLTEVFSGSVTIQANGWTTIEFDEPFVYSGSNLVITVVDTTGDYNSSYPYFNVYSATTTELDAKNDYTKRKISDLSSVSYPASKKPVIKLTVNTSGDYCAKVSNLVSSDITSSSATISWAERDDVSSYYYQYKKASVSWTEADESTSDNSILLTDLEASTTYEIRVKADCGSSQSSYKTLTFTTACDAITTLPWTTNFDSDDTGGLPNCWDRHASYDDFPKIILSSSQVSAYSGSKFLKFASYNNKQAIAVLPSFETSLDQLQLSFYAEREGSSTGNLRIGYMTDITDTNSFVAVDSIVSSSLTDNNYHLYEISFANITIPEGTTPRIALLYYNSANWFWFIDDMTVGEIPACSRPGQISTTTTTTSATINWTSTGSDFVVHYKETSSQGEYLTSTDFTSTADGYTLTLDNLTAGTNYTYYVTAICDDSLHSEPKTFKTECVALTTVPQCWDFETPETDTGLPICWSKTLSGATTGAYTSTSYYVNGTRSLYLSNLTNITILPPIEANELTLSELQLRFQARSSSATYAGNVVVGVMTDVADTSTFVPVASFPINPTFEEKIAMFSDYEGEGTHIALRLTSGAGYMYAYIDSMCLETIPECPPVQNITVTNLSSESATITWIGNNDSYLVRYKANGDTDWSTDNVTSSGASATITNLSSNTQYVVSIAPNCSEVTENMYKTDTFTTPCSAVNVPYVVDFEDETVLNCWTVASESEYSEYDDYYYGTTNYYPSVYNSTTYAYSPTHSLTIGGDYSQSMVVAAPKVNLDIEQIRLQFYVRKGYSSSYYDYGNIEIGLMTNPNDTNTFVSLHTIPETSITTAYSLQTIDFNQFTQYTGNSYYIAIKYLGTGNGYYSYCGEYQIDDITINTIPACTEPSNLATSNITANSVDISWSSEASNFKVYYKDASASDEVEYSNVDATLTDGSYTLENLQPATTYKYYVATVCSDNSEANSQVYTFTTACATLNVPYTANFEDVANYARPNCWSFINSVTQSYSPYTAYPAVSSGSYRGHSSSKGLEFHSTSNESTAAIAVMPAFNTDLNQLSVAFWTRPESNPANGVYSSGRLDVGYVTDLTDASTFVIVDSISVYTLIDSAYHKYRVNFDQVNLGEATTGYIAFRHVTNSESYYWFVDDVTVEEIPACLEPTRLVSSNATSSSIDLAWTSTETNLTLYYKEASETEFDSIVNVTLDENGIYTLENLQPNTKYNWKVGFVCSSDNQIYESETLSFTTSCLGITTVPQTWGFEADDNTAGTTSNPLPSCWTRVGSTEYPYSNTSTSTYYSSTVANTGSYALYFYNSGNTGILPPVETETLPMSGLQLSFYAKTTSSYSTATMEVGVMTDPTNASTFTSVASFDLTTTYALYEVPLSAYTGTGSYIAFRTVTSPTMYVDDVTLDVLPTCSRPNITTIDVTSEQATVTWTSTGENFEVYHKEATATDYNTPITTVTAGETDNTWTATITGLTPATAYNVYVKAICDETSQLSSTIDTFVTSCVAISSVPKTWGFEAAGNTAGTNSYPLPTCWQRISGSSYSSYPYAYPYSANTGTHSLYFSYSNSIGILPVIDTETLPLNTLQLSLYAKMGYGTGSIDVGVLTDPTDSTTFTLVERLSLTSVHTMYEVSFASYAGTGSYIALRSTSSSSVYVDDVTLNLAPACSRPTITDIEVTVDQATVTWTSTGSSFEVYYKKSLATDYNTPITTATAGATDNTWTTTISGLTPATAYNVYVKVICDETTELSSTVATFRTECSTISTFPYTEDFESLSTSDLGCWSSEILSGSTDWSITTATTGKVARRGSVAGSTRLISPIFDITSLSTPTLAYDYEACSDGTYLDSLYVYYRTGNDGEWTLLASHAPTREGTFYNIGNPTHSNTISLPNASTTYQIAFLAACNNGFGVYLDNVVINGDSSPVTPVEPTVATNVASNISQTSATLNGEITDAGNQTITAKGFEWKATNGGTYAQVLSADNGNTLTYNLTNLTANTSYTYKAFASTANGTVYGTEQVFTTLSSGDEPCTPLTASVTETLCYGESFTFNGQTYNATGTYTTTVAGQNGDCDTLYTINLTILPQNEPINEEITISQSELPYEYHGETYNDFGTYSVTTQDENGCDQVYNLTLVHNSGISEVEGGLTISLYPNPTDNNATLRVKGLNEQATIIITDQQGRVVSTKVLAEGVEIMEIESEKLASGVYYIRIQTATTIRTEKLIKQA